MNRRLRLILPVVLTTLSCALMMSNYFAPVREAPRRADIHICWALNAPATLVFHVLMRGAKRVAPDSYVLFWSVYAAYAFLIAGVWYLIGYEIDYRSGRWLSALTSKVRWRAPLDMLVICLATVLIWFALRVRRQFGYPIEYREQVTSILYLPWAVVLLSFYGRDFWNAIFHRTSSVAEDAGRGGPR